MAHLVYQPKSLIQSCFVHHHPVSALALVCVHSSPWHRVRHRSFMFGTHMHLCPSHTHIKYLAILTCSFQMAAILVLFFDLLCCPYRQSQKLHIAYCIYFLFTFIHKRNDATTIFFLKFMSIFLKFTYSFTSHPCMCFDIWNNSQILCRV